MERYALNPTSQPRRAKTILEEPVNSPLEEIRQRPVNRTVSRKRHNDLEIELILDAKACKKAFDTLLSSTKLVSSEIHFSVISEPLEDNKPTECKVKPTVRRKKASSKLATKNEVFKRTVREFRMTQKANQSIKLSNMMQVARNSSLEDSADIQFFKSPKKKPKMVPEYEESLSDLSECSFSSMGSEDKEEYYASKARLKDSSDNLAKMRHLYDSLSDIESDECLGASKDKFHLDYNGAVFKKTKLFVDFTVFSSIVVGGLLILNCDDQISLCTLIILLITDLGAALDILTALNTPFLCKNEELVYDRTKIFQNYLSTYLTLDLLAFIPLSSVCLLEDQALSKFALIVCISTLRLLKLCKSTSSFNQSVFFKEDLSFNRFVKFLALLVLFLHFCSCVWVFVGKIPRGTWVNASLETSDTELYIAAMYFCLVTVFTIGYGDISFSTSFERITAVFLLFIGVGIFSFMLSSLSTLFSSSKMKQIAEEKHNVLKEVRKNYSIPRNLMHKVERFFSLNSKKATELKTQFVECLPVNLKNQLCTKMFQENTTNIRFFKGKPRDFVLTLFPKLINISYSRGETVYQLNEEVVEMNILKKGPFKVRMEENYKNVCIGLIKRGDSIGDVQMHFDKPIGYRVVSGSNITEAFILRRSDFFELRLNYEYLMLKYIATSLDYIEQIETNKNLIIAVAELSSSAAVFSFCLRLMSRLTLEESFKSQFNKDIQLTSKALKIKRIVAFVKKKLESKTKLDFNEAVRKISKIQVKKSFKKFPKKDVISRRRNNLFRELNRHKESEKQMASLFASPPSLKQSFKSERIEQAEEALRQQMARSLGSPAFSFGKTKVSLTKDSKTKINLPFSVNSPSITVNGREYILKAKMENDGEEKIDLIMNKLGLD